MDDITLRVSVLLMFVLTSNIENKWYHAKLLLMRFHLHVHTTGFVGKLKSKNYAIYLH